MSLVLFYHEYFGDYCVYKKLSIFLFLKKTVFLCVEHSAIHRISTIIECTKIRNTVDHDSREQIKSSELTEHPQQDQDLKDITTN